MEKGKKQPESGLISPEAQKLIGKVQGIKSQVLKKFDIKEFQIDTDRIYEVPVPALGCTVAVKLLSIGDLFDLRECKNRHEYSASLIFKMMNKANPDLTFEEVCKMPIDVSTLVFDALAAKMVFLQPAEPLKTSKDGST